MPFNLLIKISVHQFVMNPICGVNLLCAITAFRKAKKYLHFNLKTRQLYLQPLNQQ